MNGSSAPRSTPANARRTGDPPPSDPRGAVVTPRTARWRAWTGSGAGMRGRMVMSSTVMAGMNESYHRWLHMQLPGGGAPVERSLIGHRAVPAEISQAPRQAVGGPQHLHRPVNRPTGAG